MEYGTDKMEAQTWQDIGSKFAHLTSVHPCYGAKAHFKTARVHLPVAPRCNIQCKFCKREINKCEYRPGVTGSISTVKEALELVEDAVEQFGESLRVVGIAGPGEPLFNPRTFDTLRIVNEKFPELIKCLSSNGLLLPDKASELADLDIKTVTATINAFEPEVAAEIYSWVHYNRKTYKGEEGCRILLDKQFEGVEKATAEGLVVKINTVLIPDVNTEQVEGIAKRCAERGAMIQNIIPLIPLYEFSNSRAPTCEELREAREKGSRYLRQFTLCQQCRADSVGIPAFESKRTPAQYAIAAATEYFHR